MTEWEQEAENWVQWARAPGHDSYWYVRDQFFHYIVPLAGKVTLDLACGEGRVARDLRERGHRVVGIDASPTLARYAREADSAIPVLVADAAALPFPSGTFDLVVAYNSLMDVADMPRSVHEASRVLEPEGRLCISVTHPINDAGVFAGRESDSPFVIGGSYFGRRSVSVSRSRTT